MDNSVTPGRYHQRPSRLTTGQLTFLLGLGTLFTLFMAWHLTLVVTAGVPLGGFGVTMSALATMDPLSLPARYDPAGPAVSAAMFLLLTGMAAAWAAWTYGAVQRWLQKKRQASGLAGRDQTRESAGSLRARKRAAWTRRASVEAGTLDVDTAPLSEVGMLLGYTSSHGEEVVLSLEDQVAVMAPTGGGKTVYVMVEACLSAPGPLIATSTRPELLDAILESRTAKGTVWVFDPLDVAAFPDAMVWDPVAGCEKSQNAVARGEAFAGGFGTDNSGGNSEFFAAAAGRVLARLLHAAALGHKDMKTVLGWALNLAKTKEAEEILDGHEDAEIYWAETLAVASEGADETLASTRMTLGEQVDPILSNLVLRQLVPTEGVQVFDPAKFVRSTDTLVIITDDQAQTNVAPLATMLLGAVIDAAKAAAAMSMTAVLDPPLRVVGDEIGNVAPIPKLPGLLSDSRGNGVQWVIAVQSLAQIIARWGDEGGAQILANLNAVVVLGGLQDTQALDRFSAMAGQTDVTEVTAQQDANGMSSGWQVTSAERTALRAEEIRNLPDGQGLVVYRNAPPMLVDLIRWTDRPDGDEIKAGIIRTRTARIGSRA